MIKRAFVLGNGRSRMNVNLKKIKKRGTMYGCNALYRDFEPDFLIAVDPKMIHEICENEYQLTHQVWTNFNTRYKNYESLNFFQNARGWSSGPTALHKACMDGNTEIFILGFDYYGIDGNFNNVYSNTPNYKKSIETATYFGNWMRQTEQVINEYKGIQFYRVLDPETKIISDWTRINNLRQINYEEMWGLLEKRS